jgi:hypothetical protein
MTTAKTADDDFPVDFKYPSPDKKKPLPPQGRLSQKAKVDKTRTKEDQKTRPADWLPQAKPQAAQQSQRSNGNSGNGRVPPFTENRVPEEVPSTLESAFTNDSSSLRNIHESLEILVDGHIKQAEGIIGRTVLVSAEDAHTISDVMFRAKHGIGGKFSRPQPWLSEWMLNKLKALPSVGGKSRAEFVDSWQNSAEERHQRQKQMDEERKRMLTGA